MYQVEGGGYGVLFKAKKWVHFEGTRDDVLATVPDALFAAATLAVLSWR